MTALCIIAMSRIHDITDDKTAMKVSAVLLSLTLPFSFLYILFGSWNCIDGRPAYM